MKCILYGDLGSAIERAEFLNKCNIPVCMEDGEVVFSSRKKLVEGLSILYINDLISDEELFMNLKRYKTTKDTNLRIVKNNDLIYVIENDNKFLCFAKNEEYNEYYLVAMDATEPKGKSTISFNFVEGTYCYDIIDTLYRVDNTPIIQSENSSNWSRVEIKKHEDSYTLNVVRKKDKTYMSQYTTLISFKQSSSKARIKYLYEELEKVGIADSKTVKSLVVK